MNSNQQIRMRFAKDIAHYFINEMNTKNKSSIKEGIKAKKAIVNYVNSISINEIKNIYSKKSLNEGKAKFFSGLADAGKKLFTKGEKGIKKEIGKVAKKTEKANNKALKTAETTINRERNKVATANKYKSKLGKEIKSYSKQLENLTKIKNPTSKEASEIKRIEKEIAKKEESFKKWDKRYHSYSENAEMIEKQKELLKEKQYIKLFKAKHPKLFKSLAIGTGVATGMAGIEAYRSGNQNNDEYADYDDGEYQNNDEYADYDDGEYQNNDDYSDYSDGGQNQGSVSYNTGNNNNNNNSERFKMPTNRVNNGEGRLIAIRWSSKYDSLLDNFSNKNNMRA